MEIQQLKCLIAVAEHQSFTKASSHVHLSQPSLSKIIKNLEEELQVTLFDRTTRQLKLTDAGEIVYDSALKLISTLDDLSGRLDDLMHIPSGEIKIGIPPLIGTLFFPSIAIPFRKLHPKISLKLVELGAKRVESLIDEEKIDLGISVLPTNTEKFIVHPFTKDEFVIYVSQHHRLAHRDFVSLHELQDEQFIIFNEQFALHDRIIQECLNAGFSPQITYQSSQWDLIAELVKEGLGITILPKSIYSKINHHTIKMVPLVNPTLMWELGVITKKDCYIPFAAKKLLNFLVNNPVNQLKQLNKGLG
ncbi:LysR family transcriptional regulator [Peribacillus asahii]|uniref:LysR family transcriptional regulator n=1 Tax=Peribacillus asahii TaxID=228899 RepID=UPI003817EE29